MFKFSSMRRRNKQFTRVVRMQACIWAVLESSQFLAKTPEVESMHTEAVGLMKQVARICEPIASMKVEDQTIDLLEKEVLVFMEQYENYDVTVSNRIYNHTS